MKRRASGVVVAALTAVGLALPASTVAAASEFSVTREDSAYRAASPEGRAYTGTLKVVVENAVKQLNAGGGGTVSFASGVFDLGGDQFRFSGIANITFAGQGMDATTIQNSSDAAADTEPFDTRDTMGITIRDMTVSAGGTFRPTSDALDFDGGNGTLIERVKVTAARGRGIVFDGKDLGRAAEHNVIRGCVVTGVPAEGIELLAAGSNRVEGCTITDVGAHGIQLDKAYARAAQPHKTSSDNLVSGNYVDNAGRDGINLVGGDRNHIIGNTIVNSSDDVANRDGIHVGERDSVSCSDNVVLNNTSGDNQPVKTQRYGLVIASPLCNRTVVSANTLTGNRRGPILDKGTDTRLGSNVGRAATRVTLSRLSRRRVRRGRTFMVRGRVTPAVAGVVVRIQLRPSGRKSFRSVRSVRAARSGRFAARLRLRRPGSYNLRATVVRTATILGSRSRPVALRVR